MWTVYFRGIDFRIEAGMDQGHVVPFEIVLDISLPVAPDGVRPPERERLDRFIRPRCIDRRHDIANGRRISAQRHEQEATPGLQPHGREPVIPRIKSFSGAEIPC
jgi:hypothetical protein